MALEISICSNCGGAFTAPLDLCYACSHAAQQTARDTAAQWRHQATDNGAYPLLSARDFALLERLARLRLRPDDRASRALLAKLDQVRVMPPDSAVPDVAGLNSRVVFSTGKAPPESRVLVLPEDHSPAGWTLPVTTSRGLALLGRAVGATVTVSHGESLSEHLRLLAVSPQPEAMAAHTGGPAQPWAARPARDTAHSRPGKPSGAQAPPCFPAP